MTAISTYPEPCWTLLRPDGNNVSDFEPHFDTEAEALKAAERYATKTEPMPTPKRMDGCCAVATAACGYVYDEEGEGQEHWTSAEELHAHLLTVEWRDLPGGLMHCHSEPGCCDECDALVPAPGPTEMPGQMDLISGTAATR